MKTVMLDPKDKITVLELNDPHPFGKFVIQFGDKVQIFVNACQLEELYNILWAVRHAKA